MPIVVCSADLTGLHAAWPEPMLRGDIHQLEKPFDSATFHRVVNTALRLPQPAVAEAGGTLYADQALLEAQEREEER